MSIKLDVLIMQLLNIGLLFFLFKKFVGAMLTAEILNRQALMKKLESAHQAYDQMMKQAQEDAAALISEGTEKKNQIIAEGGALAEKRKGELIEEGHLKAKIILDNAEIKASKLKSEIENQFEESVKTVSLAAISKLFGQKKELETEYLQSIIKEVKNG